MSQWAFRIHCSNSTSDLYGEHPRELDSIIESGIGWPAQLAGFPESLESLLNEL